MLGAIIGDIVGSPYEFDFNNIKTTDFELITRESHYTDDTVMTLAVAKALMESWSEGRRLDYALVEHMQELGRRYPDAGYGARFSTWLRSDDPQPYESYGNGAAMRVSPVAWMFSTLEDVERYAASTAAVSHNHPEGIRGAQATAAAIFLARTGSSKAEIKAYVEDAYGYDLSPTLGEIRPTYTHVESCQKTVPPAIIAFLESESFEDALRKAVSLGGDSDTLTAICGSIAEGFYGIPDDIKQRALDVLDWKLREIVTEWHENIGEIQDDLVLAHKQHEEDDRDIMQSWTIDIMPFMNAYRDASDRGVAEARSWKNNPMPEARSTFSLDMPLSLEEYTQVLRGFVPGSAQDRWFAFFDGTVLRFCRSYSGNCIFEATIERRDTDFLVSQVVVNQDPAQYPENDETDTRDYVHALVSLLAGRKDFLPEE